MTRRFTRILAAFALLVGLTIPLGMWGQTSSTVTIQYTGNTTTNMTGNNDATLVGLSSTDWSVVGAKGASQNFPGLNKAGDIRLYYDVNGSNTITVTNLQNNTISSIVITYTGENYSNGKVFVNNNEVEASDGSYAINATSFVVTNGNTSNIQVRISSIVVTYTGGNTPQPDTYTITYKAGEGTGSDVTETKTEGVDYTILGQPEGFSAPTGKVFDGWLGDDNNSYAAGATYSTDAALTLTAQWTENTTPGGDEQWVLTNLADLTATDVFVIVGNNGNNYAMSNDKGTSDAPDAVAVTVIGNNLTGTIANTIQWTISGNATDGYTFYPNGSSSTWLYCTNTNNGVRVGTNNSKTFKVDSNSGYLKHDGTSRFVGIYNSSDWRCYTSTGGNIADQSFAFYKKVTGGVIPPSITAEDVNIPYDVTSGSITYTITNGVEGGAVTSAEVTASNPENWLTVNGSNPYTTPISLSCAANTTATEKTATVTLTYTYNREIVTETVNVTQAADPNATMTIAEVREQGTGSVVTKGVVTSCVGITGYIQDATAAICVYGSELTVGNEIRVTGTLSTYHGLLEITSPQVTVLSSGNTFEPVVKTIAEINTDYAASNALQGLLVKIENATVTDIDGQNTTIAQGDNTIIVRGISSSVTYAVGSVFTELTGNIGAYDAAQIVNPTNVQVQAVPTITIDDESIDYEYQYNNININIQNFEIEGYQDLNLQLCDANGDVVTGNPYSWVELSIEDGSTVGAVAMVGYLADRNIGAERKAYFKVWAMVGDETVYSNLVTLTQAEGQLPSITITPTTYNFTAAEQTSTIEVVFTDIVQWDIIWYEADGETEADYSAWILGEFDANDDIEVILGENEGEARTAYFKVYGLDSDDSEYYSELITINQAAPATPGTWVLTDLADLTEDDVFVIVGDNGDTYAMSNDNGASAAPVAVAVTVVEGTLSAEPAANLQWNISITEDGYTFYPNGETETWLYCTNTNNGVRVGTNTNNVFVLDNGYLKNVSTSRYIGIYNSQDWRCYTSINSNIEGQSFAFYKKVEPTPAGIPMVIDANKWYLIASPVGNVAPTAVGNMTPDNQYALYSFDQSQEEEWRNYKATGAFTQLEAGKGYLYAHGGDNDVTLTFAGTPLEFNNNIDNNVLELTYVEGVSFSGYNLLGNPFNQKVYVDGWPYYVMNENGDAIIEGQSGIEPMQGFFVIADGEDEVVTLTLEPTEKGASVALNVSRNRGNVIDRARVRFDEGRQLPKFQLFEGSTKLYIPQNGKDYAVVSSEGQGELPVNFRAAENGTYTLSMDAESMDMNYLHLIDNMTGMDVDLLQTPSYTFEAKVNDYESRFRLVFAANNEDGVSTGSTAFAFYSNGSWIINNAGEATLQVVDLTGRILSSETVNGSVSKTINAVPGVYMLRLINGENVNVQKIVVR